VGGKTIIDWIVEDALPYVNDDEPLLIILGDTLFDADIQSLANAWSKNRKNS
jgi:NDP-sugar pyrophosphorylase family protein